MFMFVFDEPVKRLRQAYALYDHKQTWHLFPKMYVITAELWTLARCNNVGNVSACDRHADVQSAVIHVFKPQVSDSVTSTGFLFTTEYSSKSLYLPIRP